MSVCGTLVKFVAEAFKQHEPVNFKGQPIFGLKCKSDGRNVRLKVIIEHGNYYQHIHHSFSIEKTDVDDNTVTLLTNEGGVLEFTKKS